MREAVKFIQREYYVMQMIWLEYFIVYFATLLLCVLFNVQRTYTLVSSSKRFRIQTNAFHNFIYAIGTQQNH